MSFAREGLDPVDGFLTTSARCIHPHENNCPISQIVLRDEEILLYLSDEPHHHRRSYHRLDWHELAMSTKDVNPLWITMWMDDHPH